MFTVIWRTIKDRKVSLIVYSAAALGTLLMYIFFFPQFQTESEAFNQAMKAYPKELWTAFGMDPSTVFISDIQAFLAMENYGIIWPVMLAFLLAGLAGVGLAAEIDKGTMEILLSLPISRIKLFFSRYLMGILALFAFTVISIFPAIPLAEAFGIKTIPINYVTLSVACFLFGLAIYSIAMMCSAIFSDKGKVYFIVGGLLLGMYLLNIISSLIKNLELLKYFTFFHYFNASSALIHNTIDNWAYVVFFGTAVVCTTIGAIWFKTRDISV